MHAISSYRGNRPTNTQINKQTGAIIIQCTAASPARSVTNNLMTLLELHTVLESVLLAHISVASPDQVTAYPRYKAFPDSHNQSSLRARRQLLTNKLTVQPCTSYGVNTSLITLNQCKNWRTASEHHRIPH